MDDHSKCLCQVVSKVVDEGFRMFLTESDYLLDRRQKKMIKRSVEETFGQEALLVYKSHQPNPRSNLSNHEDWISKTTLPARHRYKRGSTFSEDKVLEPLHISTSTPKPYDMSLLGPGESCPIPALVTASVRLHEGPPVLTGPSHVGSGRQVRKVRQGMSARPADFQETSLKIRGMKVEDQDPVMHDRMSALLTPPPRLHDIERAPFVQDFGVRATKAKVGDGGASVVKAVNRNRATERSTPSSAPNEWEHVSAVKGTVDHVLSRDSITDASHSSSPDILQSILSTSSDGNGTNYGPSHHRYREEAPIKACVGQLKIGKSRPKAKTTQSRPVSSSSMTLSPASVERKSEVANLDISNISMRVGTPLEFFESNESHGEGLEYYVSKANKLAKVAQDDSSDEPHEQGDFQRDRRKQLWNSQHGYEGEKEEGSVDLQTCTISRTTSLQGQARTSSNESIRNTKDPALLKQRFRPQNHLTRPDTSSRSHGLDRSSSRSASSLGYKSLSQSRPIYASTQATSSQKSRHGEWCQLIPFVTRWKCSYRQADIVIFELQYISKPLQTQRKQIPLLLYYKILPSRWDKFRVK